MVVGRRAFGVWVIAVLLFVGVLPSVGADGAEVALEGGLPLRLAGDVDLTAAGGGLFVDGPEGALGWELTADSMTLRIVETWKERAPASEFRPDVFMGSRSSEMELQDVRLVVRERLDGFESLSWTDAGDVRLHSVGGDTVPVTHMQWRIDPDVRIHRLTAPLVVQSPVFESEAGVVGELSTKRFERSVGEGRFVVQAPDSQATLQGDVSGYLFGSNIMVDSSTGSHTYRLTMTQESRHGGFYVVGLGWMGPGEHREQIVRHLEFQAEGARLSLVNNGAPMVLLAGSLGLDLEGHMVVPQAQGSLRLEGHDAKEAWRTSGETVVVSGVMGGHVHPGPPPDRARFTASGQFDYVAAGAQEAWPIAAIASVAGVMVVAAGGVAVLQWFSFAPWVSMFTRLDGSRVLSHPLRARIYEAIRQYPGTSPQMLARQEDAGWSTVIYHLRVLENHGLVAGVRDGRHRRFFDCVSGRWANGRRDVLAVLLNPTTACVGLLVRDEPGVAQRTVAKRLGLAPSSLNWHVCRLLRVSLVSRQRQGGRILLHPGGSWQELEEAGGLSVVQAVAQSAHVADPDRPAAVSNTSSASDDVG